MRSIRARRVIGQLEHPRDGKTDLKEAAIVITDLKLRDDGEIWGVLETLSTQRGKTAQALLEDGLSTGISSRANGSLLKNGDGIDEVQEDFQPETFDLVADPSTPGAYLVEEKLSEDTRTPEERKIEEMKALLEVQMPALQEDLMENEWDDAWPGRLNDLKYMRRFLGKDRQPEDAALKVLTETVEYKAGLAASKQKEKVTEGTKPEVKPDKGPEDPKPDTLSEDVTPPEEYEGTPPPPVTLPEDRMDYAKLAAKDQKIRDLNEEIAVLKRTLEETTINLKNQMKLNHEMVRAFEGKLVEYHAEGFVEKYPELRKMKSILTGASSIPDLNEKVKTCLNALRQPDRRKGDSGTKVEEHSVGSQTLNDEVELPPMPLDESLFAHVPDDGQVGGDALFEGLRAHRRRKLGL